MTDSTPVDTAVKATKKKVTKPKKPAVHPTYSEMIFQAISTLKERGGSSRQAILKYIMKNFTVGNDEKSVNSRLKIALRAGLAKNTLKNSKGNGASGSFKLGETKTETKPKKKVVKKPVVKKPAAKKAKSPKKVKTPKKEKKTEKTKKVTKPKKATTPKKTAKKPVTKTKKPAAKKPATKAKKPAAKAKKPAKK